jgi:hypothetical protein
MYPITDDHIGMSFLGSKAVVVDLTCLIDGQVFGIPEIEDHLHPGPAEIVRHIGFRAVLGFGAPSAFLLRELCRGL